MAASAYIRDSLRGFGRRLLPSCDVIHVWNVWNTSTEELQEAQVGCGGWGRGEGRTFKVNPPIPTTFPGMPFVWAFPSPRDHKMTSAHARRPLHLHPVQWRTWCVNNPISSSLQAARAHNACPHPPPTSNTVTRGLHNLQARSQVSRGLGEWVSSIFVDFDDEADDRPASVPAKTSSRLPIHGRHKRPYIKRANWQRVCWRRSPWQWRLAASSSSAMEELVPPGCARTLRRPATNLITSPIDVS